MRDVYIVEAVRTPIGRGKEDGALHGIHPVDLLATALSAVVERAGVEKSQVEDVVTGCVTPIHEQGADIARLATLKAGFPIETAGVQLNRFCGSGQQAVHFAAQAIAAGDMEMAIGSGVEMMSRVAMGSDSAFTPEFRAAFPCELLHQGISAELLAEKWELSRHALDEYSAQSHCRAAQAMRNGWTRGELIPVNGLDRDEGVRPNIDLARMGQLKPVFKPDGVITPANSSQISDGAAAVLLASGAKAEELGLRKRARIVTRAVVGSDPVLMLTGPIDATRLALRRSGLAIGDLDAIEINEAFASVVLAWAKELRPPMERVNIQGGAIAHGHPLGATGAVLMTKLVNILERTGGRYGLQTMCIGFGMATATIIERVQ
ncbi:MAG: thiolase family protein [Acidobacteria bacterium]|nr:thiolase family protein [Acidobacteriota bacterium]